MSFRTGKTTRRRNERGIAMLVAIMAVVLLAIIGLGFMFMADTENSINNSYKDAQKSYFASRAGLENVRLLLIPPDPKTGLGAGPLYNQAVNLIMPTLVNPPGQTGVIYVENPTSGADVIDPTTAAGALAANPTLDNEICQEQFAGLGLGAGTGGAPCEATGQLLGVLTYFQAITPATNPGLIINTNTASALPFKWVRITNKQNQMGTLAVAAPLNLVDPAQPVNAQVCWDGTKQYVIPPPPAATCTTTPSPATTSMMPVWLLTSLAVTPAFGQKPGSRRITQMEVASTPPLIPNAPISTQAPVTLQGSYILNAYDNCTCTCTTSGGGSSATTTCSGTGCYSQAHAVQTAGTVTLTGSAGQTTANPALGSPYLQNVNPWPYNIDDIINTYKADSVSPSWAPSCNGTANFSAVPPVYQNCGTQSNQQFGTYPSGLPTEPNPSSYTSVTEYVPGSVKLTSGANGSGILIIDGDLEVNGGLNWYGLILVRGQVSFTGGAGQSVNLFGSILAGEDVLAVNNSQSTVSGDTFGGSINFRYDVCALRRSGKQVPPRLLATHEISF